MLGVISGHLFYSYNSPLKMEQCCVSIAFGANAVFVRLDNIKRYSLCWMLCTERMKTQINNSSVLGCTSSGIKYDV